MPTGITHGLSYAYPKEDRQVCVFVNENRLSPVGRHVIPLVLTLKLFTMKREYDKGGRPKIGEGRKQKYIVCTRLDTAHYLRLRMLVRTSGHSPAEVVRQLIELG